MVTGTGSETRLGNFYAIWFRENVLCGTYWVSVGFLFRENVLNGTNWFCEGIWFRENVLCGTEINKNGLIFL